jgi:thiopurine S-methyltransferase
MDPRYWIKRWEQGHIGFHAEEPHEILIRVWEKHIQHASSAFVPLCGKSKDIKWLSERGLRVIGCELSEIACRSFFEENALSYTTREFKEFIIFESVGIEIWCGDIFDLKPNYLPNWDLIYDRAALVALPEHMRQGYVNKIADLTPEGAQKLLLSFDYKSKDTIGPPFNITPKHIPELYSSWAKVEKITERKITVVEASKLYKNGVRQITEETYLLTR